MNSPRTSATVQLRLRASYIILAALGCCLVASSTLADPPSFLTDTPRPAEKQVSRAIRITRSAQVSEPESATAKSQLEPKQTNFSEDDTLPERSRKTSVGQPGKGGSKGVVTTIVSSLAIVIGAFLLLVWFSRKSLPKAGSTLPKEAVEVLGKSILSGRQQLQLLRVGAKLLLVNITANGAETLTEITDPDEVERLTALCAQTQSGSITATFRQVLTQFGREPTHQGFVG